MEALKFPTKHLIELVIDENDPHIIVDCVGVLLIPAYQDTVNNLFELRLTEQEGLENIRIPYDHKIARTWFLFSHVRL